MYGIHREIHTSPFYKVSRMPLQLRVLREVQTPIANHWTSLYGMSLAGFAELESYPVGACTAGYILQKVGVQALLMAWTGMKHLLSAVFSYPSHPLAVPLRCARTRPPNSRDFLSWNSHKGVSQRPSTSPSPAKGWYWTLFIQDKEPAGPCRLQGCHNEVFP